KPGDGSASPEPEVQQVLVFGRQLAHDPAQDRDHRASAERVHDAEAGAPERGQREQGAERAAEEGEEGRLDHEREEDRPAREAEGLERALADAPRRKKEKMREKRSGHIVDAFFSWCDAEAPSVLEDTPIAAGIRYARNQRVGLAKFIEDGRLPIHNNMSELALRREAVGRKNWLFVGSDDGGAVNATFTSLLASAQLCKIEPWAYLRDLFCLLSNWPAHQMLDLAPLNSAPTSARKDVRALLAANKFRDLTIDAG